MVFVNILSFVGRLWRYATVLMVPQWGRRANTRRQGRAR